MFKIWNGTLKYTGLSLESHQHNLCDLIPDVEWDYKKPRDKPTSGPWNLADAFQQSTKPIEDIQSNEATNGTTLDALKCWEKTERKAQVLASKFGSADQMTKQKVEKGHLQVIVLTEAIEMTTKTRTRVV
jgi:hypothetical protein